LRSRFSLAQMVAWGSLSTARPDAAATGAQPRWREFRIASEIETWFRLGRSFAQLFCQPDHQPSRRVCPGTEGHPRIEIDDEFTRGNLSRIPARPYGEASADTCGAEELLPDIPPLIFVRLALTNGHWIDGDSGRTRSGHGFAHSVEQRLGSVGLTQSTKQARPAATDSKVSASRISTPQLGAPQQQPRVQPPRLGSRFGPRSICAWLDHRRRPTRVRPHGNTRKTGRRAKLLAHDAPLGFASTPLARLADLPLAASLKAFRGSDGA